ncbi:beta-tubulin, putative [Medicago truncatula]|uniref:Beta-tubulin, putative n=1 Tax=Medicago truncatula TaxID=3880 RepID=G7JV46_MEDTR|nr:beta-tubulin, putative [Medicago truncatula]
MFKRVSEKFTAMFRRKAFLYWYAGEGMEESTPRLRHLCAWGNDAANEVPTEVRLLLVENYFQTPS